MEKEVLNVEAEIAVEFNFNGYLARGVLEIPKLGAITPADVTVTSAPDRLSLDYIRHSIDEWEPVRARGLLSEVEFRLQKAGYWKREN